MTQPDENYWKFAQGFLGEPLNMDWVTSAEQLISKYGCSEGACPATVVKRAEALDGREYDWPPRVIKLLRDHWLSLPESERAPDWTLMSPAEF